MDAAWMMHNIKVTTGLEAAAMQMAIWEVIYDGMGSFNAVDPYRSVHWSDGGNFRISSWSPYDELRDKTVSYLELLYNATDYSGLEDYRLATNCFKQDMLTTVPVPAAVWLMGSGLFGLIAVGRRRSSKEG
jgi:hypothetical protein